MTEVTDSLGDVTDAAVSLRGNLDDLNDCLKDLQKDLRSIRSGSGDMQTHLDQLGRDLARLQTSLDALKETLQILDIRINGGILSQIPKEIQSHIKVQGQQLDAVLRQVQALERAWAAAAGTGETIGFSQFQAAALVVSGQVSTPAEAAALLERIGKADAAIAQLQAARPGMTAQEALTALVAAGQMTPQDAGAYTAAKPQLALLEQVYTAVCGGTGQPMSKADFFTAMLILNDINALPESQKTPEQIGKILAGKDAYAKTGRVLSQLGDDHDLTRVTGLLEALSSLLDHMGSGGLTGDLSSLTGKTDTTLGHLDDAADTGRDMLDRLDTLLRELRDLDDTINDHVPGLRGALQDTRVLVSDLVTTLDDTHGFLTSFRSLARTSGTQLDAGTRQSLENLAASLRKTARSTDAVGDVKTAKNAMTDIIEDTWNEYTGDVNNLLLMDATAEAVSLTSPENGAPTSIQVLIRTQEIKQADPPAGETSQTQAPPTTFWGRVAQMFRDLWNSITGLFR